MKGIKWNKMKILHQVSKKLRPLHTIKYSWQVLLIKWLVQAILTICMARLYLVLDLILIRLRHDGIWIMSSSQASTWGAKARASSSSSALDIPIFTEDLSSKPDRVEAKKNVKILDEILDQAHMSSYLITWSGL